MRNILTELRFTILGAAICTALVLVASLANVDLIKLDLNLLNGIEKNEVDDIGSGLTLIFIGLAIDRVLSHRRKLNRQHAALEAQKLRTHQATMRTVHDIVNNFLNGLQLFELPANDDRDILEELIQDTSQKLKALGDLESIVEKSLAVGIGIEYPGNL